MAIYHCTSIDIDIDVICKSYNRNPFVEKNENNSKKVYKFKFRGEEVCITIPYLQPGTLCVNGNGGNLWYEEATHIFKYERLHSGRLQRPESVLESGESKKQLVKDKDFRKCFANPYAYGTHNWPDSTILLYKFSTNAISKYWEIPEDTWKKIVNTEEKHSEEIMIEDLEKIQDYLAIQPDDYNGSYKAILSIEVILSYSPCDKCSKRICQLKKTLDEKVKQSKTRSEGSDTVTEKMYALSLSPEIEEAEKVKFKITFSNFYKHISRTYGPTHIEGLKNLMKSDIKLDIFTKENWDYFFNAAGLVTERPCRQRREKDDRKILQYLEQSVALYKMQEALEATEEDLQNNDLL